MNVLTNNKHVLFYISVCSKNSFKICGNKMAYSLSFIRIKT